MTDLIPQTLPRRTGDDQSYPTGGKSATRVLQMLNVFRGAEGPLGLTDLARRAGVPKSTAFRLLATLEQSGFLERSGASYVLSPDLELLGTQARRARYGTSAEYAYPYLCELFAGTKCTTGYAVLDGAEAIVIERVGVLPGTESRARVASAAATAAIEYRIGRSTSAAEMSEKGISMLASPLSREGVGVVLAAPHPRRHDLTDVAVAVDLGGDGIGALVMTTRDRRTVTSLANLLRSAAQHIASQRTAA